MKKEYVTPTVSFLNYYVNEKICCVLSVNSATDNPYQHPGDKSHHHHGDHDDHKDHSEYHRRH